MKKIVFSLAVATAASLFAADSNPYANYECAMASDKARPMAAEWQNANAAAIEAATNEETILGILASPTTALALLDKLRGAYATDPMVMTQIAAVTQWVMQPDPCCLYFWKTFPSDRRRVWVFALKIKIASTGDGYVRTFCNQQLDLCK